MTERYNDTRGIHPFICAPGEGKLQQRLVVVPEGLAPYPEELTDLVSKFTLEIGPEFPFISQVQWFRGFLVLSTTVQTLVPETFSGRKGLNVTFGALVSPTEIGRYGLARHIVTAFQRYFHLTFGGDITVDTVSEVLQGEADPWNVESLRRVFESSLPVRSSSASALAFATKSLRRRAARSRLAQVTSLAMGKSLGEALRYWAVVDAALEPHKVTATKSGGTGVAILLALITLCVTLFLEFAAVAWPSAPRMWRSGLAISGFLITSSAALVLLNAIVESGRKPALIRIAAFMALAAAIASLAAAWASLTATLR